MAKHPFADKAVFCLKSPNGTQRLHIVGGRTRWALDRLMKAGGRGITSMDNPAPRLAAYVFLLRESGFDIETITEPHAGDYPGHHARYVLRSIVTYAPKAKA
jgi:hypothetical protein